MDILYLISCLMNAAWYFIFGPASSYNYYRDQAKAQFQAFYNDLYGWIQYHYYAIVDWVGPWLSWLQAWAQWAQDQFSAINSWIDNVRGWLGWFINDPLNGITYYLGYAWDWISWFASDPLGGIELYLGSTWSWLRSLVANPFGVITDYLGYAWDWISWFASDPLGAIQLYLGWAWDWLAGFAANPLGVIDALTGGALGFYISLWEDHWQDIADFFYNPALFILEAIAEIFLDWLENLIADAW